MEERAEEREESAASGREEPEERRSRESRVAGERRRISEAAESWDFSEAAGDDNLSRVSRARGVRWRRRRSAYVLPVWTESGREEEERDSSRSVTSRRSRERRAGGRGRSESIEEIVKGAYNYVKRSYR